VPHPRATYADDPAVSDLIASTGAELVPRASVLPVAGSDRPDGPVAAMSLFLDDAVRPSARALALIPRAMRPHADQVDTDTVTFVDPCLGPRRGEDAWARPADAENVLLISRGSPYARRPEVYRRCLAAFGDLPGRYVALQIGRHTDRR
jgi:UDP:flavonoid glycosyltransferase YjiC (YdhE family)